MYNEELQAVGHTAKKKVSMLENHFGGALVSNLLGGLYVCFGTMLAYAIGGLLGTSNPASKIAMGLAFGIALTLIVFAGADLFTSNTMYMAMGVGQKTTTAMGALKVCAFSWAINFAGSIIAGILFVQGGLINDKIADYVVYAVNGKISLTAPEMLIRGILCNTLVCLASWMSYRMKNEAGKVLMILWAVFAFMVAGYEHSIANMGLFTIAALIPQGSGLALGLMAKNLIIVTIGNVIGGSVIMGLGYTYMSKKK